MYSGRGQYRRRRSAMTSIICAELFALGSRIPTRTRSAHTAYQTSSSMCTESREDGDSSRLLFFTTHRCKSRTRVKQAIFYPAIPLAPLKLNWKLDEINLLQTTRKFVLPTGSGEKIGS